MASRVKPSNRPPIRALPLTRSVAAPILPREAVEQLQAYYLAIQQAQVEWSKAFNLTCKLLRLDPAAWQFDVQRGVLIAAPSASPPATDAAPPPAPSPSEEA